MQINEKERKELQEIFDLVDRDKGGTISPDELYQLMRTIGVPATKEAVNQVCVVVCSGEWRVESESGGEWVVMS
jgi:Ca2+-binding EF-hand superfamily protein